MPASLIVDFMRRDSSKYWCKREKAFRSMILLRTFCFLASVHQCMCVFVSVSGGKDDVSLENVGRRQTISFLSEP